MVLNGFLFGCALLVIVGAKVFMTYISHDPCEGSGNFRDQVYYDYEDDDESTEKEELTKDMNDLSKKIDKFNRRE